MPAEFRFLVDTGIPFLMEKPWGIDDKTVNELADLAESKHAWAAVPMPFRYSLFAETAVEMRQRNQLGTISHMLFRFNQPGVQRYVDLGSPWMLSKADAGGGALINLGIHGFDLFRYITAEEPQVVSAVTSHAVHKREVEDYAHVTLRTPSGIVFLNEASYTYPGSGGRPGAKAVGAEGVPARDDQRRRGCADRRSRSRRDTARPRGLSEWLAESRARVSRANRTRRAAAGDGSRLCSCGVVDLRCVSDGGGSRQYAVGSRR